MLKRTVLPVIAGALALVVLFARPSVVVRAQGPLSINFGALDNKPSWPAGPDYATDVLGDPWDFSNPEDVSPDPTESVGWTNFSVNFVQPGMAGGHTALVNGLVDSTMTVLTSGRYGVINPGRNGRRYPIDSNLYQKISLRVTNNGSKEAIALYWYHTAFGDPAAADPTLRDYGVKFIGDTGNSIAGETVNAIVVQQLRTDQDSSGTAWARSSPDVVRGIRLDPNTLNVNADVFFDWVRLTRNDDDPLAANVTISWGGSGAATVYVTDLQNTVYTILNNVDTSQTTWNYGVLPPGVYTMHVTRGNAIDTRNFTINNPPLIHVVDPDETGGEDFATKVLANAWDMDSAADVKVTGFDNYTPVPADFIGGEMKATNTNGDPGVTLLFEQSTTPVRIDTSRYRYLTYRYQVDGLYDLRCGSVTRILWGSQQFFQGTLATTTKDIVVWPGMNSYTFDLGALSVSADGGLETTGAAEAWTSGPQRHFRFDPHEFDPDPATVPPGCDPGDGTRPFHIDDVKLAAMDETVGDMFTIKWDHSNWNNPLGDSSNALVNLYYDLDTDPANMTLIQSGLALSNGATGFIWDTTNVPAGVYYIYASATDAVPQTYGRYSTGTVRVVHPSPTPPNVVIEKPTDGGGVLTPFDVTGWALDHNSPAGTGIDYVQMTLTSGGAVVQTGKATLFGQRDDVAASQGSQFKYSGFTWPVGTLTPGASYSLTVEAHSIYSTALFTKVITFVVPTSNPQMGIDAPTNFTTVPTTFTLSGWSVDLGDPVGTGVERVNIYAYPFDGIHTGAAIFLGIATYGAARPDIVAQHGFAAHFTNCGFSLPISTLSPGRYFIIAYSESKVAPTDPPKQAVVDVTVKVQTSGPLLFIDGPAPNQVVTQPFNTGGWAADQGAFTGTGVDAIHVWAFPVNSNGTIGAGKFVDAAVLGGERADVAAILGEQFRFSGFNFLMTGLQPGTYIIGIYARSTVTNTFNSQAFVQITIPGPTSNRYLFIDGPQPNQQVTQPFNTGGWAIDAGAPSGIGVDAIHVWAFPIDSHGAVGAGHFVDAAVIGGDRPDVAAAFGNQFRFSGYNFLMTGLAPGQYILGIYTRSTVKGDFDSTNPGQTWFVRITVLQ